MWAPWRAPIVARLVPAWRTGLTRELRDRVFERFDRVDPSRFQALGGSRIDLAIVKALIEIIGG